jgi:membrane-bound lytic murein transglycosylase A
MNDSQRKIQWRRYALAGVLIAPIIACDTPSPQPAAPSASSAPATSKTTPPSGSSDAVPATAKPKVEAAPAAPAARTLTRVEWTELPGWAQDDQSEALPALLTGCRALAKQAAWRDICDAAPTVKGRAAAKRFFETQFTPYRLAGADGMAEGFITGYYEPTIRGSRKRSARNRHPVYGLPDDMLTLELGDLAPELKAAPPRVRIEGKRVVPYHARAVIDGEAAPLRGKEVAWVADLIDLFFVQVQGSGRIQLDEGGVMRIGFAGHNGLPYRSIGRVLVERGDLTVERASMQGIKSWAQTNPGKLTELLNQNPRYVFFRELTGPDTAPLGALGVPLTPLRSVAVDPNYVPLGVPVHITTTWPNTSKPLQRLMLAQDTGGAIRGTVRADFYWGAGEMAAREAGRMQQALRMWLLLPQGLLPPPAVP